MNCAVLLAMLASLVLFAQRKQGSPLDSLPKNVEILTHFGERADISPDNQRVAFMAKSFGDAFVIDRKTREIRCLTCSIPGAAFLRVMHLSNGDYLLIGPAKFTDIHSSRGRDNELWYLSRKPGAIPVQLGQKMSEGAAVSKQSNKIAFSETSSQNPELPKGASRLVVAMLDWSSPAAVLRDKKVVRESSDDNCTLEAQDFFANDSKLTFTCYEPKGRASVWSLDFATGEAKPQSRAIGSYNEVEGIFPGGEFTCVESDQQAVRAGLPGLFRNIDIWKLRLDGTGRDFTRLTFFNDYEGWKASNPVVATDGSFMAFQTAKSSDEAGVGYGILLLHFR